MKPTLDDGRRALEVAAGQASTIRIEVDEQYAEWIAEIEARPDNQSGTDKTSVWDSQRVYLEFFEHARQRPFDP